MHFNRFDIVEAYYLAYAHCHGGQWSDEYARLCHIEKFFSPSPMLEVENLNDNARAIYEAACVNVLANYPPY